MLTIHRAVGSDIEPLRILARTVWQATYSTLISQAQIDYMLSDRYGAALIRAQLDDTEHAWRLACWADERIGFAHARMEDDICKLDKLYIHPDYQRRGVGRALLNEIKTFAVNHAAAKLCLQVNRGNIAAIAAYQHYGFIMREARVFDIGGGFVMDDYVMETPL
mgnify:CR=1 FL=1